MEDVIFIIVKQKLDTPCTFVPYNIANKDSLLHWSIFRKDNGPQIFIVPSISCVIDLKCKNLP